MRQENFIKEVEETNTREQENKRIKRMVTTTTTTLRRWLVPKR